VWVAFHPEATKELIETARYYEQRAEGVGRRFLQAIEQAEQFLRRSAAVMQSDERGRRRYRVKGFPYQLIYRVGGGERVFVLAVAHTSRRPGYWDSRDER
jgi:plasmid stabilization system protein ParE